MPHKPVEPNEPPAQDTTTSLARYRVTGVASDTVLPPAIPGKPSWVSWHVDRSSADEAIEVAVGRTDLARILLEERLANDVKGRQNEWHVIHSWERTDEGWRHQ